MTCAGTSKRGSTSAWASLLSPRRIRLAGGIEYGFGVSEDEFARSNRWAREEPSGLGGGSVFVMNVPSPVPAPRCSFCGGEIRVLGMGMFVWNRAERFDGIHLIHKIECDPTKYGRDVYESSVELMSAVESPDAFIDFLTWLAELERDHAGMSGDAQQSIDYLRAAIGALALAAFDAERVDWDALAASVERLRPVSAADSTT